MLVVAADEFYADLHLFVELSTHSFLEVLEISRLNFILIKLLTSFCAGSEGKAAFEFLNAPQFIFELLGKDVEFLYFDFHLIAMGAASSISVYLFTKAIFFFLLILIILCLCVLLQQSHYIIQVSYFQFDAINSL